MLYEEGDGEMRGPNGDAVRLGGGKVVAEEIRFC